MTFAKTFIIVPVILAAVACGDDAKQVDSALNNDLTMAAQMQPGNRLDSITAAERGAQSTPARQTTRRSSSSSSSSRASSASSAPAQAPTTYRVEKHSGRDAAIGAGAGAVIGAATSKNKVKGGLIGAAAGGILGAVIGNNVDKKKVPNN